LWWWWHETNGNDINQSQRRSQMAPLAQNAASVDRLFRWRATIGYAQRWRLRRARQTFYVYRQRVMLCLRGGASNIIGAFARRCCCALPQSKWQRRQRANIA